MRESEIAEKLKRIEKDLYEIVYRGFSEARKDKYWLIASSRYRANRIWEIVTHMFEQAFSSQDGIFTDRSHGSCRFILDDIVFRFKKLSGKQGLPQNVHTRRNAQFLKGQLPLFNVSNSIDTGTLFQLPITVGYWTDKFFSKVEAIEVVCHGLNFRYEIAEPKRVIRISDHQKQPKKETTVKAKKTAKEKRKKDVKREEDNKP